MSKILYKINSSTAENYCRISQIQTKPFLLESEEGEIKSILQKNVLKVTLRGKITDMRFVIFCYSVRMLVFPVHAVFGVFLVMLPFNLKCTSSVQRGLSLSASYRVRNSFGKSTLSCGSPSCSIWTLCYRYRNMRSTERSSFRALVFGISNT